MCFVPCWNKLGQTVYVNYELCTTVVSTACNFADFENEEISEWCSLKTCLSFSGLLERVKPSGIHPYQPLKI